MVRSVVPGSGADRAGIRPGEHELKCFFRTAEGERAPAVRRLRPELARVESRLSSLAARPGVASVHDVHIWALSTTEVALTAHLVMPGGYPGTDTQAAITAGLHREFGIDHATLQIEVADPGHGCSDVIRGQTTGQNEPGIRQLRPHRQVKPGSGSPVHTFDRPTRSQ